MRNFGRVLRLALRYRWTFVFGSCSAMIVAVLWGANIGTVYPFVEVVFKNASLQQWVRAEIAKSESAVEQSQAEIVRLERLLQSAEASERAHLIARIELARSRIAADRKAAERFRWVQPYIDRYLPDDPFQTVLLITGLLLAGTLLKAVFLVIHNVLVERLAQLSTLELRKLFYRRTLRMDLASFGDQGTADLMSRFTHDMENVANGLAVLFGKMVREPLKMLVCLIGAALISWRLLVLSLLIAPVAGYAVHWLAKMLKRANRKAMEEMARLYAVLEETFRGIKIVKAFTSERHQRKRFHDGSKAYFRRAMKIARYDALVHPMTEILGILAISLALLAGAYLVLKGQTHLFGIRMCQRSMSLSSLLLFYGLLAGTADPLRKFSDVFSRLQRAMAAADRIFDRLDREPSVREPACPVAVGRHRRDLVFERVCFSYRPGQTVLEDIELRIPFGQTVAIVGPNGCGKSTLISMVPRFYDPTAGRILLDGVPLTQMRLRDLRSQIGLVTQETVLLDDTVFNNIRFGRPDASREDVIRAAQQAHAHRFITEELPDGYDTMVGTLGGRLSGGQRQRIALARAILRDPAIILLDEATSQVDLESERAIQEALEQFTRNRTAIIVTHRIATLALADWLVVMRDGRIVDVGTHAELLARCDFYRRLYTITFEDHSEPLAA